jgi:hypothetical protein
LLAVRLRTPRGDFTLTEDYRFIGAAERILQSRQLKGANLVDAGLFDRLDMIGRSMGSSSGGTVSRAHAGL